MKSRYSEGFKSAAIKRHLLPGGPSLTELSRELGMHVTTIKYWRDKYGKQFSMGSSNKTSKKLSPEEILKIINETSSLSENDLGKYLREKGLHASDIDQWKQSFFDSQKTVGRAKLDSEVVSLRKDKKELECNLRRKDKAMAELSARVILLKKSHKIFGVKEDDE